MNALLEKIRSRGNWRVRILPANFDEARISNLAELEHILDRTYVQFRGWEFPHSGQGLLTHFKDASENSWIGQETDRQHYVELWRFFQSGQFIYHSGMKEDWQSQCGLPCLYGGIEPGEALDVLDTLSRFSEIFEFAARLTFKPASFERINLEVTLNGLKGRTLWDKPGGLYAQGSHSSQEDQFRYQRNFSFLNLADSKEPALKAARELFQHFGWNPRISLLRDLQTELLGKSPRMANAR